MILPGFWGQTQPHIRLHRALALPAAYRKARRRTNTPSRMAAGRWWVCWTRSLGAGMSIPWWTRASAHVGYRNLWRNDGGSYWVVAILMLWRCRAFELTPMRCHSFCEVFVALLSGRSCTCASAAPQSAEALRNTNNFDVDTTADYIRPCNIIIVNKCNDA